MKAWRHLKFEMQDIPMAEMLLVDGQLVWGAHLPLRGLAWSTTGLNLLRGVSTLLRPNSHIMQKSFVGLWKWEK